LGRTASSQQKIKISKNSNWGPQLLGQKLKLVQIEDKYPNLVQNPNSDKIQTQTKIQT